MFDEIAISQVSRNAARRGVRLVDQMRLFKSGQFMTNGSGTVVQPIFAHQGLGCHRCRALNVLLDKRPQDILFALAQWYHLLIHPRNDYRCCLRAMILRLSTLIASSLML